MHLGLAALERFFDCHKKEDSLVLATVIAIQGSSYRKPGAMMLVAGDGGYAGMISGGCLEDDLLLHAREVLGGGEPKFVTYDNQADEQLVWNLGLGCEGVIHLLLQRLDREGGFGFLPWLFASLARRRECVLALVTRSGVAGLPAGSHALINRDGERFGALELAGCLNDALPWGSPRRHREASIAVGADRATVLLVNMAPVPRVLICGAGPDALPLTRLIADLGWECLLVDHRPAHAQADRFPAAAGVFKVRPDALPSVVALGEVSAAVVMSHHLERDTAYLEQILKFQIPYVGLLGPADRRRQIQQTLGCRERRIHGPVGLDIGAELPESIALAVLAEIHASLNDRDGRMLSAKLPT